MRAALERQGVASQNYGCSSIEALVREAFLAVW